MRFRSSLETERNRRVKAEAIISRATPRGRGAAEFPDARTVARQIESLMSQGLRWTSDASKITSSHAALPSTLRSILVNTFLVCREEVKRCLDERLASLSAFLGSDEPVNLMGGDSMNLDTQYVLYERLCKNFQTIVSLKPARMAELVDLILSGCGGAADNKLAKSVVLGSARHQFEALIKSYMVVFVEVRRPLTVFSNTLVL